MPEIEITLPRRGDPKTRRLALPGLGHRPLDELSELAHGYFRIQDANVPTVQADAVNDFLKATLGKTAPRVRQDVSAQLFTLVLSRHLYNGRLKEAYDVAGRHGLTGLQQRYENIYREKLEDTLRQINKETGVESSRTQAGLEAFGALPLRKAWNFFKRHQGTLDQVAGVEREEEPRPQAQEEPPSTLVPKGRPVYLTFDDGPGPWTEHLVGMLAATGRKAGKELPANFFVAGNSMDAMENGEGIVKRTHDAGHTIGLHTQTHAYNLDGWPRQDVVRREIREPKQRLERLLESPVRHFRFPGGIFSLPALRQVRRLGMEHVDWSLDTGDYHLAQQAEMEPEGPQRERMLEAARHELIGRVRQAIAGDVILMHDGEVLQPEKIADMPVRWADEEARQADAQARRIRSEARGRFVTGNIDGVIDALHEKRLVLSRLPQDHRGYNQRYARRFMQKIVQAIPGVRKAAATARRAVQGARKLAGDLLFGRRRGRK